MGLNVASESFITVVTIVSITAFSMSSAYFSCQEDYTDQYNAYHYIPYAIQRARVKTPKRELFQWERANIHSDM